MNSFHINFEFFGSNLSITEPMELTMIICVLFSH